MSTKKFCLCEILFTLTVIETTSQITKDQMRIRQQTPMLPSCKQETGCSECDLQYLKPTVPSGLQKRNCYPPPHPQPHTQTHTPSPLQSKIWFLICHQLVGETFRYCQCNVLMSLSSVDFCHFVKCVIRGWNVFVLGWRCWNLDGQMWTNKASWEKHAL